MPTGTRNMADGAAGGRWPPEHGACTCSSFAGMWGGALFSYDGMNPPLATTESWGWGRLFSTLLLAACGGQYTEVASRGSKQGRWHESRSRVQKLLQHRQDQFSIVIRKRHVASCAPKAIIQGLSTDVSSPSCFRDMLPDASVGVPGCTIWHLHPRLPRPLTQQQLQSPMM